jgi:hypothetical protein
VRPARAGGRCVILRAGRPTWRGRYQVRPVTGRPARGERHRGRDGGGQAARRRAASDLNRWLGQRRWPRDRTSAVAWCEVGRHMESGGRLGAGRRAVRWHEAGQRREPCESTRRRLRCNGSARGERRHQSAVATQWLVAQWFEWNCWHAWGGISALVWNHYEPRLAQYIHLLTDEYTFIG